MQSAQHKNLPLTGIKVIEFTHMVMGPTCGMILADLGAEVIKIEPIEGDATRRLMGSGAGFFSAFNRNKKSLCLDIKHPKGKEIVLKLLASADVFSENFKSGTMSRLGLTFETIKQLNPRLIYVSHKGFLPGPYQDRTALDEVVQMMGGLAYMTGPEGRPLRAGSSVNDIMGGMFGAIGVLSALHERHSTGKGQEIQSALFENNVFLMSQHMMQFAITGKAPSPMPSRISAWAIYDVFTVKDNEQIFLAAVSDTQWELLCQAFKFNDLIGDTRLKSNNDRVKAREWLLPDLRTRFAQHTAAVISEKFQRMGLPYAAITRPQDLFDDPHLQESGGLTKIQLPADTNSSNTQIHTEVPLLPLTLNGKRLPLRTSPPNLGHDTFALLQDLGYDQVSIDELTQMGIVKAFCT